MPCSPLRRALLSLTALLCAGAAVAAPKWHTLQAPHCLVVSQLNERDTRAWATEFEQFTAALRTKILINEAFLPPLTVVLFADRRGFAPFYPLGADGKPRSVGGFCSSHDSWSVIGLAEGFCEERTRQVILHEATHWHVSATPTPLPLWLNEGAAEAFSTFKVEKGCGVLGAPLPENLEALREDTWLPLFHLLITSTRSPVYRDNNRNRIFYAQSWLFVHKLLFEDPAAGHETVNRFYAALARGATQVEAMESATGRNLDALEKELARYLRGGHFTFEKLPAPPELAVAAPFQPAAAGVVDTALARLALARDHHDLARRHLEKALAEDPAALAPQEVLAALEFATENFPAAGAAARRAIAAGSRDAAMHTILGQVLWRHHRDRGTLDSVTREIAECLGRAVALQPKLRTAYLNFANLAPALPTVTVADAQLLVAGFKLFPDEPQLLVGLAALQHTAGNDAEAERLLDLALTRADLLTAEQRATADLLRVDWQIAPLRTQLEELRSRRRYEDALAVCDRILALPLQQKPRLYWENRREDLHFSSVLRAADTAITNDNPTEATRLLEELLTQPHLPPAHSRRIRERLEHIRPLLPAPPPQS